MSKNKKIFIVMVVAVIAGLIIHNNYSKDKIANVIRIGGDFPITGNLSKAADSQMVAMKLALKHYKESHKLKYNYEFVFEDNAMDNKKANLSALKMKDIDKVDMVFSMVSDKSNIINNALGDSDILHASFACDPNISTRDMTVQYCPHPEESSKLMAEELKKRNIERVNVFILQSSFFLSKEPYMKEFFDEYGIKYNFFKIRAGERDFRMIIGEAKEKNAGANILLSYSPELEILNKQIKESGMDIPITAIESFAHAKDKKDFDGDWLITPFVTNDKYYIDDYKKLIGTDNTESSEYTYEFLKWLIGVCENAPMVNGHLDTKYVLEKIKYQKNFDFNTGKWIVKENGYISIPSMVGVVENSKIERL